MPESLLLEISNTEWAIWGLVNRLLPYSQTGDNLSTLAWFLRWHKRWPMPGRLRFNDVLYRLKTSGELESPLRARTADKALMKDFVAEEIGGAHCVPTIAVLESVQTCRDFDFPARCVIKPTHLSGPVILRKNGEPINHAHFAKWFADNYYYRTRERQYRALKPKVIVEEYALGLDEPADFKFFCFRGRPGLIQVNRDRNTLHVQDYYDTEWNLQPFEVTYPQSRTAWPRPANLAQMLEVAARLSAKFSFVRIDLYSDGKRTVVGEFTHIPANIRTHFVPRGGEDIASRLIFGKS